MKILDISRDIARCSVYPGDPITKINAVSKIKAGDECNLAEISMCLHTGTHTDAPLHFLENGNSVDKIPLDVFLGECKVINVPGGPITGQYVEENFPQDEERVLIKGNGKAWFIESGAEAVALKGIKLIGIDAMSVGTKGNQVAPHKAFLRENITIIESLNLDEVKEGKYFLCALPLKISSVEASPVRAVLIEDYIFWAKKD